ncbi:MAG: class I SAM-dependent methyltransferase [Betaproteobacteria bacterium]|nr:class I SAM-dependent methyltransferase [Betaproteobacteria bacterium]
MVVQRQTGASSTPAAVLTQLPSFDVIALWQVIEHLDKPLALLDSLAAKLAAGGVLALSTPNPDSFQFARMGKHWPHVDAPRHLYLLPAKVLIERLRAHGLETCLLESNDADAKSWNRFGWQRLIMNRLGGTSGRAIGMAFGGALSLLFRPLECGAMRGSTYTLVMRKIAA